MIREIVFHLDEDDHEWVKKWLSETSYVELLSYNPIKKKNASFQLAELLVKSSSGFYDFLEKHHLWERLFFYEEGVIVPILKSKNLGAIYSQD